MDIEMSVAGLLSEWMPSEAAIELLQLNGVDKASIDKSLAYLKSHDKLNDIADVDGYNNWNEFFIMFCIKAHKDSPAY